MEGAGHQTGSRSTTPSRPVVDQVLPTSTPSPASSPTSTHQTNGEDFSVSEAETLLKLLLEPIRRHEKRRPQPNQNDPTDRAQASAALKDEPKVNKQSDTASRVPWDGGEYEYDDEEIVVEYVGPGNLPRMSMGLRKKGKGESGLKIFTNFMGL